MKKITLLIVLPLLLTSFNLIGQISNTKSGLKVGVNYAQFTPDYKLQNIKLIDYRGKLGFYLGYFTNMELNGKLKIQPELLFSFQGSTVIIKDVTLTLPDGSIYSKSDYKSNINESTIVVPIILQYYLTNNFHIGIGPQFEYIIISKEKVINNPLNVLKVKSMYYYDYHKFNAAISFDSSYKLTDNLAINGRFCFGVIKRDSYLKTSALNIGVEYQLKKRGASHKK